MLDPVDTLRFIETESDAVAATITAAALEARVPSCPDWSLIELIWHLGLVQRFWAGVVRAGGDVEPTFPDQSAPEYAAELDAWFRASTRELLDALGAVAWGEPAWTWWKEPRTVGAIARHQVQEAAVHRWDAQLAVGSADPLRPEIADDGVDEFLAISRQLRGDEPIAFRATDTDRTFAAGADTPTVTASAPASDLVLLLYRRIGLDDVQVDGDRVVLDAFLIPMT